MMDQSLPLSDARPSLTHAALIVALVLLVGVPSLFTRDLWNPDEPRYMEVAREMVLLDDYTIPHLNGEVYSEKPPMFFWLTGLLWRAGLGYNSGRIVTIAAVCGTLLLTYVVACPWLGATGALLGSVFALTSFLVLQFTKIGVLDPLLMLFETTALVLGYAALTGKVKRVRLAWIGCYVAMGLGILTKGPVGALVPALILLTYGIVNRRNVKGGGWVHAAGAACLAAVVLAWLIPAIVQGGPEYTHRILVKQTVGRAVRSYSHRNPVYYYLLRLPIYFFPWSFVLPFAIASALRQWRREGESLPLFASLWVIVTFVFFSLISGKRANYVVPMAPAVGMLAAWYFSRAHDTKGWLKLGPKLITVAFVVLLAGGVVQILVVVFGAALAGRLYEGQDILEQMAPYRTFPRLAAGVLLTCLPLLVTLKGMSWRRAQPAKAAAAMAAGLLLLSLPMDLVLIPAANTFKSGRAFGEMVEREASENDDVYFFQKTFAGVYNLYTGRVSMPMIETADKLREALRDPNVLIITDLKHLEDILDDQEHKRYAVAEEAVGHRTMLLLRGIAPAGRADVGAVPAPSASAED